MAIDDLELDDEDEPEFRNRGTLRKKTSTRLK